MYFAAYVLGQLGHAIECALGDPLTYPPKLTEIR
jgi:hypothetical protein